MANMTHDLNVIARCTLMERSAKLEALGVSGVQVKYLLRICRHPGLTGEEIARALYVNKSSAARQLSALEKAGLVERVPRENDRRCLEVRLTAQGEALMPRVRAVVQEWNDYLLEDMDETERERFLETLARLSDRAKQYIETEVFGE